MCTARFNAAPQRLTAGTDPEFAPAVVFDPANGAPAGGKIWVFWSRQKTNGLWNIFYRTSTNMNFPTGWTELELTPVPSNYDRQEPAVIGGHGPCKRYHGLTTSSCRHTLLTALD